MNKKKKLSLGLFCSVACAISAVLGVAFAAETKVAADEGVLQADIAIAEKYSIGTDFKIPEGDIIIDGESYAAESYYLRAPNGTVYSGREHFLEQLGVYTVIYSVKNGSALLSAEQSFTVVRAMYETSSNFSNAAYAEELVRPQTVADGLQVTLADGDSFSFNEPIDVTQTSEFFSFYPHATYYSQEVTPGKPEGGYTYDIDANRYIVRLTDCYDPNNYVETEISIVVANRLEVPYSYCTYFRAGAGVQLKAGLEVVDEDKVISAQASEARIDGVRYQVWYGATYGTSGRRGSIEKLPACSLKFDAETNRLYVSYGVGWSLINDLDNMEVNGADSFKGFKTGEVYLSVYAGDYLRENASFEISKIGKYENSDLNFKEDYQDTKAPNIVIDAPFDITEKYYVAKGEPLTVFNAWATDVHLVGNVYANVFYGYDTGRPTQVFCKDGKFTPVNEGDYTIVYTATDSSGNVANQTISLRAIDCGRAVSFETEELSGLQAGTVCVLPEYTVDSVNHEEVFVSIYAIFEGDEENKVSIDTQTRSFLVENVGKYEIRYVCQGLLTTTEYSYELDSVSVGQVRIDRTNAYLPKYFIKGASYTLDEVRAYSHAEKFPTQLECSYFVIEDGKEREIDYLDYTVQANSTVRFKYECEDAVEYSETLQVVDVGFKGSLVMENYFIGDVTKESKSTAILFTANATTGNSSMEFINVLSLNAFSLALKIPSDQQDYQAFSVRLRDIYNENIYSTLRFAKNADGNMTLSVDGGLGVDLGFSFTRNKNTTVSYDSATNKFSLVGGPTFDCLANFTSDRVVMEMTFENINGSAGIEISNLSSQRLSKTAYDVVTPYIVVDDKEKGERARNTIVTVFAPSVSDVLSPYLRKNISLKFILPDGSFATSLDGVKLDGTCRGDREYQVSLSDYGSYRVEYTYKDQAGNQSPAGYAIYVSDRTPPTVSIDNGYDETTVVKKSKGDSYTIVGYTVDDNFGADGVTSWVAVVSPMNKMTITEAGAKIELDEVGRWKICYYCQDAEFNYTVRYYYIDVQ